MLDQTARCQAEAHTTLRATLRVIQAITASDVEGELVLLEERQCPLFQRFADNYGFVFGYSEVLQASLISLMEPLIGQPEAFGYTADEDLQRWWFFLRDGGTQAIPAVTESSDEELANMLATINGLVIGCRRAGHQWEKLTEVMRDTQPFARTILASLPKCRPDSNRMDRSATASVSDVVKHRAAAWLAEPLWNGRAISSAVQFINHGGHKYFVDEYWVEEITPNVLTPLDEEYGLHIPMPRTLHPSHPLGVLTAVAVATANLLESRINDTFPYSLKSDGKTLTQCLKAKLDAFVKSYEYVENQVLVPSEIIRIPTPAMTTPPEPVYSQHRRLKAILGRSRRLVASADELSPVLIAPTLHGLCSRLAPNERVNVLWIRSMRDDTPYTKITIALAMPLTGMFSDQTTWWCFYGVAGTGTSDPDVIRSEDAIDRLLGEYGQHIRITDVGPLDDDQLIQLFSPHGWNALRAAHKYNVDANADLRAALSETMAALYIGAQGYGTVLNSVKLKNADREIDAVGGRCSADENQILAAEVKGRSTHDQDLRRSYERFCELVDKLQQEPSEIIAQLRLPSGPTTVKGIYISLGDAEKFEIPESDHVQLWGFDEFCKELEAARVPGHFRDLLRKEHIAQLGPPFGYHDWMMFQHHTGSEDDLDSV